MCKKFNGLMCNKCTVYIEPSDPDYPNWLIVDSGTHFCPTCARDRPTYNYNLLYPSNTGNPNITSQKGANGAIITPSVFYKW